MNPQLIITADDYGMSPQFNEGIHELAALGILSGISVMIRRKYIRKQTLLKFNIPLGLHLELNEKSPSQEVEEQIKRFKGRLGRLPSYLDGHQHQHLASQHFHKLVLAAKKHHLPVRSRYSEDRARLKSAGISTPDNFISWHPDRIAVLKERLLEVRKFKVSELVVHPGYYDEACTYSYNRERTKELAFLKSRQFMRCISDFNLTQYSRLKA